MKVISFALWGSDKKYLIGALRNVEIAKDIYPDWVCRFYLAHEVPFGIRYELKNHDNAQIVEVPQVGNWVFSFNRFFAMSEPDVDVMISRDTDSRLTHREKSAVDEWLASDKGFHIMKDHPWHYSYPILAGMFGCKKGAVKDVKEKIETFNKSNWYHSDQEFLKAMILPEIRNNVFIHDDWNYNPFPLSRNGLEFVGQVFDENENTVEHHQKVLRSAL